MQSLRSIAICGLATAGALLITSSPISAQTINPALFKNLKTNDLKRFRSGMSKLKSGQGASDSELQALKDMCNKATERNREEMNESASNYEKRREGTFKRDKGKTWDKFNKKSGKAAVGLLTKSGGGSYSSESKDKGEQRNLLDKSWKNEDIRNTQQAAAKSEYDAFQQDCDELVKGYFNRDTVKIQDAGETTRAKLQTESAERLQQMKMDHENALLERQERLERQKMQQQQQQQYMNMGAGLLQNLLNGGFNSGNQGGGGSSSSQEFEELKQMILQQQQTIQQLQNQAK